MILMILLQAILFIEAFMYSFWNKNTYFLVKLASQSWIWFSLS